MSIEMPKIPEGSGQHPIALVVISANNLAASSAFYSNLFGWQLYQMSPELTSVVLPAGPMAALRANVPAGFPGMVPYIGVPDVDAMLARVVAAGGAIERAAWSLPMVGKLARFKAICSDGALWRQAPSTRPSTPVRAWVESSSRIRRHSPRWRTSTWAMPMQSSPKSRPRVAGGLARRCGCRDPVASGISRIRPTRVWG